MKRIFLTIIALLFCSGIAIAQDHFTYPARCLNVVDGDTIDLKINLGMGLSLTDRVRFLGFDAPETFRPKTEKERARGEKAKKFLKNLIENKDITIHVPAENYRGSFGRILVVPFYQDQNIIKLMKQKGFEK